jgi:hypothetical protein
MVTSFLASLLLRVMHDRYISRWTFTENEAVRDYFVSLFLNASEYQRDNKKNTLLHKIFEQKAV